MNSEITKQRIRDIVTQIITGTELLETCIYELDNFMNECNCSDRRAFDFRNISTEEEGGYILCINCGGYIEPKDLEDCGIF